MQEVRRGELDADKWPVIVSLGSINLFSVHVLEFTVSQVVGHRLQNLPLVSFLREDDSHVEVWWNAESENAINVSADYLQVHQRAKQLLEALSCCRVQLRRLLLELLSQNVPLLLVGLVLFGVVVKYAGSHSRFAQDFSDVVHLILVSHQAHYRVLFVLVIKVVHFIEGTRHNWGWETRILLVL